LLNRGGRASIFADILTAFLPVLVTEWGVSNVGSYSPGLEQRILFLGPSGQAVPSFPISGRVRGVPDLFSKG